MIMSRKEFAIMCGTSPQMISKNVKNGKLTRMHDGRFDTEDPLNRLYVKDREGQEVLTHQFGVKESKPVQKIVPKKSMATTKEYPKRKQTGFKHNPNLGSDYASVNDWKVETDYFLNRWAEGPDYVVWWITLTNISPGVEYAYQYFVDGDSDIRIGDPFGHKVLDPWNDQYIDPLTYPNLKPYPQGKTKWPVTTVQTGLSPYPWQITNFNKPPKEKLVIYELLIRDFLDDRNYQTLKDTLDYLKQLGINAIELMPIMEFEGNISWGYNPMYHLAPDKYYGPANELKSFIDSAKVLRFNFLGQ